jgi:hypothetical protein
MMRIDANTSPVRAYRLMSVDHAISTVSLRRLKVARPSEVNDPFELLGVNCMHRILRRELTRFRHSHNSKIGLLCFSEAWKNPVLWSHYADGHRGICLGFDLNPDLGLRGLQNVIYEEDKLQALPDDVEELSTRGEIPEYLQQLLLFTKYGHWKYEQEIRAVIDLETAIPERRMYFYPFGNDVVLREVILGHLCSPTLLAPVRELTKQLAPGTLVSKARLGFKFFEVKGDERYPPKP